MLELLKKFKILKNVMCLTSFWRENLVDICDISITIFPFLSPLNGTCIKRVYAGFNTIHVITQRQLFM